MANLWTPENVRLAATALRKGAGTYLKRHAEEIASAALQHDDEAEAAERVKRLVAHTSVGHRNYAAWTKRARAAVVPNGMPSDAPNGSSAISLLLSSAPDTEHAPIAKVLQRFPQRILDTAAQAGIRIQPLHQGERYDTASPALRRMGVDVDSWPTPPAGLFVVEERCLYLRSRSEMTIAHEFAHGIDCALGGGVYLSSTEPEIKRAFSAATAYVTPYAATGCDEYFAESVRAFVEANDPASFWPRATRARLQRVDPTMYAIIERLFTEAA